MPLPGVYYAVKKNGSIYYRSSVTYRSRHISLGSFETEHEAHLVYERAKDLLSSGRGINDHEGSDPLPFDKAVILVNFRDNNVYIKNPIYLQNTYIEYYLDPDTVFKFDIEDLFFYSVHRIQRRGGHFFVADYGMQVNLNTRYGIKRHAVYGRDYRFINGDRYDYRYENIEVINSHNGVMRIKKDGKILFKTSILINGTVTVGIYDTLTEAAIAYNKAADILTGSKGSRKYELNYIDELSPSEYADKYTEIKISPGIYERAGRA
ncbi:MAG: hypothetical protein K5886_03305 [Lachnospiraceae bacterium]|nr:hypothetical protein [Lachnospiraceae bacterium]